MQVSRQNDIGFRRFGIREGKVEENFASRKMGMKKSGPLVQSGARPVSAGGKVEVWWRWRNL